MTFDRGVFEIVQITNRWASENGDVDESERERERATRGADEKAGESGNTVRQRLSEEKRPRENHQNICRRA